MWVRAVLRGARRRTGLVGSTGKRGTASHDSGPLPKFIACAPGQPWQSRGGSAQDSQYENRMVMKQMHAVISDAAVTGAFC